MAKLTDTQKIVLSQAAARDDGAAVVPAKMTKAAASKVGSSLVARKLMREVKTKPDMPVWKEDKDGRRFSLTITRAGRDAIRVNDEAGEGAAATRAKSPVNKPPVQERASPGGKQTSGSGVLDEQTSASPSAPRAGSKQALVIAMLSSETGANLDTLINATGWLPHTTRAALTGLRKRGFAIERSSDGEGSVYRIVAEPTAAAA
jgi:Protein of unknown function (DUF3489)